MLELRTGLGVPSVESRAKVAAALGLPVSRIPLLEARALNQLRAVSGSSGCGTPSAAKPVATPAASLSAPKAKPGHKHGALVPLIVLALIAAGPLLALGLRRLRRPATGAATGAAKGAAPPEGVPEGAPAAAVAGPELRCPSCGEPRLAFNEAQRLFRCRACGAQGPLAETVSRARALV